jgi:hypothetical protein
MATLINGDGNQAVYAAQDADLLSGAITNNKTVILDVGEKFSADVLSSSVIEVHDGVILTKEGRRIQLDQNAVDLFEFPAGAQGVVSWYYIGYKLEIDEDSHQICSTFVQKMDSEGDTIPEGSFRDGDQEVYISLYHVQQDTLGVLTPTLVLTENMTMIDVLDNLIGSASDLPDPTKTVTKNIDQINSDLTKRIEFNNYDQSFVQWNGSDNTFNWLFRLIATNQFFALKISYNGLEYVVSDDGGQTWRTLWTNNKAIAPTLIKENKVIQCDAVYVPAYTYTATKKTVISLSVKGSWGNGICEGIRFKIDGTVRQACEENNIPNASYSTVLEAGQSIQVDVKYSNYTMNEIIIDGFALQIW